MIDGKIVLRPFSMVLFSHPGNCIDCFRKRTEQMLRAAFARDVSDHRLIESIAIVLIEGDRHMLVDVDANLQAALSRDAAPEVIAGEVDPFFPSPCPRCPDHTEIREARRRLLDVLKDRIPTEGPVAPRPGAAWTAGEPEPGV